MANQGNKISYNSVRPAGTS